METSPLGFPSPKSNKRGDDPPNPTPWGCDRACPLGQVAPGESRIGLQEGGSTWGFLPGRLPSCTVFAGPQPADLAPSPLLSQLQARASKGPSCQPEPLLPFCSFALGTWEPLSSVSAVASPVSPLSPPLCCFCSLFFRIPSRAPPVQVSYTGRTQTGGQLVHSQGAAGVLGSHLGPPP